MNCDNYHSEREPQDPDCPYCVIVALTVALEKVDPTAAALTPAMILLSKAQAERRAARWAAR